MYIYYLLHRIYHIFPLSEELKAAQCHLETLLTIIRQVFWKFCFSLVLPMRTTEKNPKSPCYKFEILPRNSKNN